MLLTNEEGRAMETIYDHGVTEQELNVLYFDDPDTQDEYLTGLSQDSAYADLVRLYRMRGDDAQAETFVNRIQNRELRQQFRMIPCCVAGRFLSERQASLENRQAA
jgi:hypothetical protein